ncbi:MAG: T9SS type A sorting domain-containing protein [Flavobacteriales bacterium]|nr:T9SS type A sorting domain-containing protein [Flavobacteriales bacterium]
MIRVIACLIALMAMSEIFGQGGDTFIRQLSNHVGNFGIDMVSPSVLFQRSDSSFMIFGRIREGADRYYPVYQQYDRKGGFNQSKDFNLGFSTLNYGHGSTFETGDGGIIHRGGVGWQGEQVIIKFDSKLNEQWRITADSTISSSRNLVVINNHLYSFFTRYSLSGSYETLLKITLDSGKVINERALFAFCGQCDTTYSSGIGLLVMGGRLYFSSTQNPRDDYKNHILRYFEVDSNLNLLGQGQIPYHVGYEISRPFKLGNSEKILFFQDSVNNNNNKIFYSVANSYQQATITSDYKNEGLFGKVTPANEFYDNQNRLYIDVSIRSVYPDTNWGYAVQHLIEFGQNGEFLRKLPLNHKDSAGRYHTYQITNLQRTLNGGFAFTVHEPPGHSTYPWHLVVTDSNMLVDGKPFWHRFYSGDTNKTIGIIEDGQKYSVGVFPNPVDEKLNISFNKSLNASFELRALNGLTLLIGQFENSVRLDVSNIPNGIYFLQIRGEGISETRKVVISH